MTNKRIKSKSPLLPVPDWKHADLSVRRIGETQGRIAYLEEKAKLKINGIKKELADQVKSLQEKITLHFDSLEAFATTHRAEFNNQKSRKLNFGVLGWRKSTCIRITKKTLGLIKKYFSKAEQKEYIRIKETVDKDVLAKLTDENLADMEARRDEKDVFFVEPDSIKAADHNK